MRDMNVLKSKLRLLGKDIMLESNDIVVVRESAKEGIVYGRNFTDKYTAYKFWRARCVHNIVIVDYYLKSDYSTNSIYSSIYTEHGKVRFDGRGYLQCAMELRPSNARVSLGRFSSALLIRETDVNVFKELYLVTADGLCVKLTPYFNEEYLSRVRFNVNYRQQCYDIGLFGQSDKFKLLLRVYLDGTVKDMT